VGLAVCCLGCRDAKSSGFQCSSTPPLSSFFNQMACSGVEGIRTAAAADESVQFWRARKHMHVRMDAYMGKVWCRHMQQVLIYT